MEIQHLNEWSAFEDVMSICSSSSAVLSHAFSCGQSLGLSVDIKGRDYYYCFLLTFGTLTTDISLATWHRLFWPLVQCIQFCIWDFCTGVNLWEKIKIWNWCTKTPTCLAFSPTSIRVICLRFICQSVEDWKKINTFGSLTGPSGLGSLYPVPMRDTSFSFKDPFLFCSVLFS